jgi:hypothetical protein
MAKRIGLVLAVVVLVAAAGGGGFFYGKSVGAAQADQARQQFLRGRGVGQNGQVPAANRTPQPGSQNGNRAGGGTVGTVESVDGDTVVINTQQGTVRVKTTDTTLIEKFTSVGVNDLKAGEQVVVNGSRNDDGSITARSIQSLRSFQGAQGN